MSSKRLTTVLTKLMMAQMKVAHWSANNRKTALFINYLFFPITIPCGWVAKRYLTWLVYMQLKMAKKQNNENAIFQLCSTQIKNQVEFQKWKSKVSKKWFHKSMTKQSKKLYDFAIEDKTKISFNYFMTLIEVYSTYNIIGGATINTEGDTVVEIR